MSAVRELSTIPVLDPFAYTCGGMYADPLVEVRRAVGTPSSASVSTAHFDVFHNGPVLRVAHRLPPARTDGDLAGLLAAEQFTPGWLRGADVFERIFTGVVLTSDPDPLLAWEGFYRRTLARMEEVLIPSVPTGPVPAAGRHGTIDDYAPVYAHAESLLGQGSVLELGSCFGFLSLRIAAGGRATIASDLLARTMRLLGLMAPRLDPGLPLVTQVANASHFPASDRSAGTVLAVHLLEHLDAAHGDRVVAEAVRLAAERVVIGVPLEDVADATYGHMRTVSLDDLRAWGRETGMPHDVHEHHGGWLVIDTRRVR